LQKQQGWGREKHNQTKTQTKNPTKLTTKRQMLCQSPSNFGEKKLGGKGSGQGTLKQTAHTAHQP